MTRHLDLSAIVLSDRHPIDAFLADVMEVERFGARTVWLYDHLTWPRFADHPWHATVPLLAAAAAATSSVRLGTQVASPNFRHPVTFAKELMTLDHLAAGRIEAGVGAGTAGADAVVLGGPALDSKSRIARFGEWLELLDRLLREPVTTLHCDWYSAVDAHQLPGCVQVPRIPFTVAATGPKGLALVARLGQAWVTFGPADPNASSVEWLQAVRTQSLRLDDALATQGRPREDVRRIAQFVLDARWPFESVDRYRDTVETLREYGFDEITVHWARPDGHGVPRDAIDHLAAVHRLS
jgi:alkanesulfonate monooxygenase SsuD/methylene tetrahydromethanopterin reductase-like flavin-dependent oxidoreductase (luciferase family)